MRTKKGAGKDVTADNTIAMYVLIKNTILEKGLRLLIAYCIIYRILSWTQLLFYCYSDDHSITLYIPDTICSIGMFAHILSMFIFFVLLVASAASENKDSPLVKYRRIMFVLVVLFIATTTFNLLHFAE